MVFTAICMAAVNHNARFDTGLFHPADSRSDGGCIVVGDFPTPAEDDMAVRVAGGEKDGGLSRF